MSGTARAAAAPGPVGLRFHPDLPGAPGLQGAFAASHFCVSASPEAPVVVAAEALAAVPAGQAAVVLFDGAFTAELAQALEGRRAICLLARAAPDAAPAAAALRALAFLLGGAPLNDLLPPNKSMWRIARLQELRLLAEQVAALAEKAGARKSAAQAASDVAYELAANGLLDAPVDAQGTPKYAHRRDESPEIAPEDACRASVGFTPTHAWLSVDDTFGRLTTGPLGKALGGLNAPAKVDATGGGAGLGLRRVLEHSELTVVRVRAGLSSEVVSAVNLGDTRRRTERKSLLFSLCAD